MNANVTALRSVRSNPGRSIDGNQCRICGAEKETLGHVLGSCTRGELIRNHRHHGIREIIAKALIKKGWKVAQEVHCQAENGSNNRVDIIAYDDKTKEGFILDPTVRIENGESEEQAVAVDLEKRQIYEPCIKDLVYKFQLKKLEVIGLYVGARGTITKFFQNFMSRFLLPSTITDDILMHALRGSIKIYNHHINNCN